MKGGKYTNLRPYPRFGSEEYFLYEISEEMFYLNLQEFVSRPLAGAHLDGHQQGGRGNKRNISY